MKKENYTIIFTGLLVSLFLGFGSPTFVGSIYGFGMIYFIYSLISDPPKRKQQFIISSSIILSSCIGLVWIGTLLTH